MIDELALDGAEIQAFRATAERIRAHLQKAEALVQKYRAALDAITTLLPNEEHNGNRAFFQVKFAEPTSKSPLVLVPDAKMRDAAIAVLHYYDKPMSARELYETAVRAGWGYTKPFETFRGGIFPILTRDSAFEKSEPGMYRLSAAWRTTNGQ